MLRMQLFFYSLTVAQIIRQVLGQKTSTLNPGERRYGRRPICRTAKCNPGIFWNVCRELRKEVSVR
jgi:hypothetical protein